VLRVLGTTVCYASGNAGGIFGPSLFIGAMLGGTIGSLAHTFAPHYTATVGVYALVGMGTAFAGIVRVPLTSVFMIFEVTRDYSIIVPLMISNLISFFISMRLQPEAIYEALSRQDGIHLPAGQAHARRSAMRVAEVMRSQARPLAPRVSAAQALLEIGAHGLRAWPVAEGEELLGLITVAQLESANDASARFRTIGEIMDPLSLGDLDAADYPHIHTDHSLDLALQRMRDLHLDVLPVVSRGNVRELLGVIALPDILRAYGIK
jgi:CIC family chloride channel protein